MLPWILVGIGVVLVALIAFVASRPAQFTVTRSATMSTTPERVFELVNNFHRWGGWSPWERRDPNMSKTYAGPDGGKGAEYAWSGNKDVGQGMMRITDSVAPESIKIHLEFVKPFKATNTTEFKFAREDRVTRVTWSMVGNNNFMGKAMSLFMDMDKMIGADFEEGLAKMKSEAEQTIIQQR